MGAIYIYIFVLLYGGGTSFLDNRLTLGEFQRRLVKELRDGGDRFIYFCDGGELLEEDAHECTVDGVHPTDLGFLKMAKSLKPVLEEILH